MARATTVVIASNDCACDPLRIKRDSSAGALDGLGKRGMSVGIVNHGRADDEPEADAGTGWSERRRREDRKRVGSPATQRNVVRGQAGIVTERSDGAIPADAHGVERWTSPTTQGMARDVPERSEDVARPVTCPVAAG